MITHDGLSVCSLRIWYLRPLCDFSYQTTSEHSRSHNSANSQTCWRSSLHVMLESSHVLAVSQVPCRAEYPYLLLQDMGIHFSFYDVDPFGIYLLAVPNTLVSAVVSNSMWISTCLHSTLLAIIQQPSSTETSNIQRTTFDNLLIGIWKLLLWCFEPSDISKVSPSNN